MENVEYLQDKTKKLGFGEQYNEEIAQQVASGVEKFEITRKIEINKKEYEATLRYGKSAKTGDYFLNNYRAALTLSNGEKREQTFYLDKGWGVTSKESFNLLDGRAVYKKDLTNKAGEKYDAWLQLDFAAAKDKNGNYVVNHYHTNYGYNLRESVGQFNVMELDGGQAEAKLMQSLEKGNLQVANIGTEKGTVRMFVEANPSRKIATLYDEKLVRVPKENLGQYKVQSAEQSQSQGQGKQQEQKQEVAKDVKQDRTQRVAKEASQKGTRQRSPKQTVAH